LVVLAGFAQPKQPKRLNDLWKRIHDLLLYARFLPVAVNGDQVKRSHRLKDGDMVLFIMPVSGG
jgi:molybdopterin converting factor small subunit